MDKTEKWVRPPRRFAASMFLAWAIVARSWALPFVVAGWIVGAAIHAACWGFGAAWNLWAVDRGASLWDGERKIAHPVPIDDSDEDWDDDL